MRADLKIIFMWTEPIKAQLNSIIFHTELRYTSILNFSIVNDSNFIGGVERGSNDTARVGG